MSVCGGAREWGGMCVLGSGVGGGGEERMAVVQSTLHWEDGRCVEGGGGVGAVVESTLHKNSDNLHRLSLSLSVKSGTCSYQSC